MTTFVDERLYLEDDPALGVVAERDPAVRERHIDRYRRAIDMAGQRGGWWLDCACGSGYGSALIRARASATCLGVDRDATAIAYARKHHGELFLQLPVEGVMREYDRFDVIVSLETVEHLPWTLQARWVRWCAEHAGIVVMAFPVGRGQCENPWHLHEPTTDEIQRMFDEAGFTAWEIHTEEYDSTAGPATQAFVKGVR